MMQGKKTHEQQRRILERKPDFPDARELDQALRSDDDKPHRASDSTGKGGRPSQE